MMKTGRLATDKPSLTVGLLTHRDLPESVSSPRVSKGRLCDGHKSLLIRKGHATVPLS
jgi:hypothetical protein